MDDAVESPMMREQGWPSILAMTVHEDTGGLVTPGGPAACNAAGSVRVIFSNMR